MREGKPVALEDVPAVKRKRCALREDEPLRTTSLPPLVGGASGSGQSGVPLGPTSNESSDDGEEEALVRRASGGCQPSALGTETVDLVLDDTEGEPLVSRGPVLGVDEEAWSALVHAAV